MKKFIALIVVLCAVMISSSASATTYEKRIPLSEFISAPSSEKEKLESELNEQYRLVFTVTLTAGLIVMFFAYKYFQNRQLVRERSFASWLSSFIGEKNFWALIFCVVSLVTCIFYVPYNLVGANKPNVIHKTAHATIFDAPKNFKPQLTKIDYEAIEFREVLILLGCCAGYTASTIIKKK